MFILAFRKATNNPFIREIHQNLLKSPVITMKFPLLKSLQISSVLLLSLTPQTAFCAEEKKKDDISFEQWVTKIGGKEGLKNREIHDIISNQMKEGGALLPLKRVFESGMAGQVGYGFLMGYSSGYCIKRVSLQPCFFFIRNFHP